MNESVTFEAGLCGAELTLEHFRNDMLNGLSEPQKRVPCKYFYDEKGARLFEAICELEEYYPTRTEVKILRSNIGKIAAWIGPDCNLVELGSGSGLKTRLLLDHLERQASYMPIDVARAQLLEYSARVAEEYPGLAVTPLCADYTNDLDLPRFTEFSSRTLVFFPGSTIGNFEPAEAEVFLRRLAAICGSDGGILLGVDLKKERALLDAAYNDSRGITAAFNLNLLSRANRELAADFDRAQFRHEAFYNEEAGRIEMHLVSRKHQVVSVAGAEFSFDRGESILTEHSYKYTPEEFSSLAARAGFNVVRCWTDEERWFSVQLLAPRQAGS
jgi:dimethylhistidine N-methyltransferase